jgi:hypothetical protein
MKLFFLSLLIATTGFADTFVLQNQTSYPSKGQTAKIAVQWASTAREVDEGNKALIHGYKLDPSKLQPLIRVGKIKLNIPKDAEYFRVLAWSKGQEDPDLITNWVEIVPNKTYTLEADHLFPAVLMSGCGC